MNDRMVQRDSGILSLRNAPDRDLKLGLVPLLIGLALLYLGMFAGQVVAVYAVGAAGLEVHDLTTRQQATLLLAGQLGGIVALAVFLTAFWGSRSLDAPTSWFWRRMGVLPHAPMREIGLAAAGILVLLVLYFGVAFLTNLIATLLGFEMPEVGHVMLKTIRETESPIDLALLIAAAVVMAPVSEEFAFRGFAQTAVLNMWGPNPTAGRRWLAILITSIGFSLLHAPSVAWQALPGLVVVGMVLGWLYERSGSLMPPILVHMCFNGLMILATLLFSPPTPVTP